MAMKNKDPFDFSTEALDGLDSGDQDQAPEQEDAPPQEFLPEPEPQVEPEEMTEEEIDLEKDVMERLAVAHYYGSLLKHQIFPETNRTTNRIQKEIRVFVQGRLRTLVGMKAGPANMTGSPASDVFSQEEVEALRNLAKHAEALSLVAERLQNRPTQPALAQVPAQVRPLQAPLKPVAAPPAPLRQVQQAKAPAPAQAPQKPAQKPVAKAPTVAAPAKKPVAGRAGLEKVSPAYRDDPSLRNVGGQWFVDAKDDDGNTITLYDPRTKKQKALPRNVTIQAPGLNAPKPLPFPSVDQFNQISSQQAFQTQAGMERAFGNLSPGLGGSLLQHSANRSSNNEEEERQ